MENIGSVGIYSIYADMDRAEDWQNSTLAIRIVSNLSGELFSRKLNILTNEVSLLQLKVNDYRMKLYIRFFLVVLLALY